jgi:formylglycine-generating enzyme required for sulfatase activity
VSVENFVNNKIILNLVVTAALIILAPHLAHSKESAEFADKVIAEHGITGDGALKLKRILTQTPQLTRNIGTEDPNVLHGPNNSWHMASRQQCINKGKIKANPKFENICKAKWMAPIPNGASQSVDHASVCIDQFEFPNLPCEYPVVWSTSGNAQQICESMGKRLCNAHEWEGACAGSVEQNNPYRFSLAAGQRRASYNRAREKTWAFSWLQSLAKTTETRGLCGVYTSTDPEISMPMRSNPSDYYSAIGTSHILIPTLKPEPKKYIDCNPGAPTTAQVVNTCGTNTWPSGFKDQCATENGVYDMHGNVAEAVSLPTSQAGIFHGNGSNAKANLAATTTEHKGSFFVYRGQYADLYPDDCRVRQPGEHNKGSVSTNPMAFYQEGFRCCKDVN